MTAPFISIYQISAKDVDALQNISRQTFYETFATHNTEADMTRYLAESFSIEKLSAELQHPESEFYLAEINNQIVGYLKLNFKQAQTELKNHDSMEIERIYVLSLFHGKQIGQLLLEKAIDIARSKQISDIWLGVWEKNPRALRFYQKNGFVEFDKHIFRLGSDEQTDILMRLNINSH